MTLEQHLDIISDKSTELSSLEVQVASKKTEIASEISQIVNYFPFTEDTKIISGDRILKIVSVDSSEGTDSDDINFVLTVKYPLGIQFGDPRTLKIPLAQLSNWSALVEQ